MELKKIIQACKDSIEEHGYIDLSPEIYELLGPDHVSELISMFGHSNLMRLPKHEVQFFEWLKHQDRPVWDDLWGSVEDTPYLVSLAFIDRFAGKKNGGDYLICDLQVEDNYFFSPLMFRDKESWDYLAAVQDRFNDKKSLSTTQAFALEASVTEVDVWHFAYRNKLSIESVKKSVQELVEDRIIVHVTKADHLTEYFDV